MSDKTEVALDRAELKHLGDRDQYVGLLADLAGAVKLDEKTRNIVFGQVLGMMSAEVARRAARAWQYFTVLLITVFFVFVIWSITTIINIQWQFLFHVLQQGGSMLCPWNPLLLLIR